MTDNKAIPSVSPTHKGVLHSTKSALNYNFKQYFPSEKLSSFIEQFWVVEWNIDKHKDHKQTNLPQPSVHITFEKDKIIFYGPVKKHFTRTLSGQGHIFGIKFLVGGFFPVTQQTMSSYTNKEIPLIKLVDEHIYKKALNISFTENIETKIVLAEDFLQSLFFNNKNDEYLEKQKSEVRLVNQITSLIETKSSITQVKQLSQLTHLSERKLQRLFRTYVGVSPKWLIRKFRITEVLARIEQTEVIDWQQLVLDLDYVDQSHFINDFKYFVGNTPQEYLQKN